MNTAIRAHRILGALENFQKAEHVDNRTTVLAGGGLGELIGYYRNPGMQAELIGVFSDGLAWFNGRDSITIRFADLTEVALPSGKESEGLQLKTRDGRQIQLPVRGQRGKFFDSMEMLRFLDRIMQDLSEVGDAGTPPT
jgi:hypothetical protein